jgi:hypothetical protein
MAAGVVVTVAAALRETLHSLLPLMRRQTTRTTKPHPAGFRAKATLPCPGHDQLTLELGQATEHGKHQPAMGCRGISPSVLEALEAGATLADGSQDVEQVARRPGQPIKTRHQQHVTRIEVVEHLSRGHKLCTSGGVEPGACHDRFLAAS